MSRLPLGAVSLLLSLCFAGCVLADSEPTAVSVSGGTSAERQAIAGLLQKQLSGLIDPAQPISVKIVTPAEMRVLVDRNKDSASQSKSSDQANTNDDTDGDVDGLYDDDPPTITLLSGDPPRDLALTFLHEYGHHLWAFQMNGNDRSAYNELYARQLAAGQLVTDYAKESPEEGFAEAVSYYLSQPDKLKRRDPASYRYVDLLMPRLHAALRVEAPDDTEHIE